MVSIYRTEYGLYISCYLDTSSNEGVSALSIRLWQFLMGSPLTLQCPNRHFILVQTLPKLQFLRESTSLRLIVSYTEFLNNSICRGPWHSLDLKMLYPVLM